MAKKKIEFKWVCEYCFDTSNESSLPDGWTIVMGNRAACRECTGAVKEYGGIFKVKSGEFAYKKDPRNI